MRLADQSRVRRAHVFLVFLFAVRPGAPSQMRGEGLTYSTYMEKSVANAKEGTVYVFHIPSGQCSGYIDQHLLCSAGTAELVSVLVRDAAPYADVRIDDGLRHASVLRAGTRCDSAAEVVLRVACAAAPRRAPRSPHVAPPPRPAH